MMNSEWAKLQRSDMSQRWGTPSKLMNSEQNPEECDATKDAQGTEAGKQNKK
jgi:hypothetical protein